LKMADKADAASILLRHIVVFDDVEISQGQTAILSVAETEIKLVKPRNPRQTTLVKVGEKRGRIIEEDIVAKDGRIHAVDILFL